MFAACKHMQLLVHRTTHRVLWQHAFHGEFNRTLRVFGEQLAEAGALEITGR